VVLKNINFVNGNPNNAGGALLIRASNILVENCTFTNNKGVYGGAIYMNKEYNSKPVVGTTILNCEFSGNTATKGGGAIYSESKENLIQYSKFTNNKATGGLGGAVFISGSDNEILNNVFTSNTASQNDGGALSINEASNQLVANNTFIKNYGKNGGAVNLYYAGGYTVINNVFDENTANLGGAMRLSITSTASESKIANNTFKNNKATTHGGAISSDSDMAKYTQNTFTNNEVTSGPGGAINLNGNSNEISYNVIENCSASTKGGAIALKGDSNSILHNYIGNCHAESTGGAIYYYSGASITINNNNIKSNDANDYGGAIHIDSAKATIKNNIISDNSVKNRDGGALFIAGNSAVISGNTFTSNNAGRYAGAIKSDGSSASITSNIFKGNTATRGLAIASTGASLQITKNVFIGSKSSDSTVWWTTEPSSNKDNVFTGDGGTYTPISTAITASDVVADYNSDAVIVATLKDAYGTAMCDVNVVINVGNINEILTTDERGEASLSTNGLNPGNYTAVISYAGNDIYASSSKSINVKINKYISTLISQDVTVDYGDENGELAAGLFDNATGAPIVGADVIFSINGNDNTVKTDSEGQAKVSTVDLAPGNYTAVISFNGNTLYNEASTSANVAVTNIPTSINAVYDEDAKELTATLINNVTGQAIKNANVRFIVGDKKYTVKTDASGNAVYSTANLDGGTYTITASYEGNSKYSPSSASVDVIIKARTAVSLDFNNGAREIVATLINDVTGQAIKNANVRFEVNGVKSTVKSDDNGQAKVSVANLALGTYEASASYIGNSKYIPSNASVDFTITKIMTSISQYYDETTQELVATLINSETGQAIKGATIVFNYNGVKTAAKTDKLGQARLHIGDPVVESASLSYGGNSKYLRSYGSIKLDIDKVSTVISNFYYKETQEVVATLINRETGQAIKGATVVFNFNGVKTALKTDKLGQVKLSVADLVPDEYYISSSYGGNSKYAGSVARIYFIKI
ncbi:right-handed parallel beta-helix repeat-containing protein, partial [Methanobrevibacter sp.]|uniref:right-handed parallel beta-helix repeat-containing protein n=1 Tax=Methanobrevibacter sp. TaxID=66852 RepID=UPI0025D7D8D8